MKMNQHQITKHTFILFICICLTSCLNNVQESFEEIPVNDCATETFAAKVKPIIDANCVQCHGTGGNSPNLTTYSSISANAAKVKSEVESRRMPQGFSLSNDDIKSIVCWVNEGAKNN